MLLQLKSPIITIHSQDEIDDTSSEKVKYSEIIKLNELNSDVSRASDMS